MTESVTEMDGPLRWLFFLILRVLIVRICALAHERFLTDLRCPFVSVTQLTLFEKIGLFRTVLTSPLVVVRDLQE
jgi:hypothetical protein